MPPLTIEERLQALNYLIDMMEAANRIAALGFHQLALEKYRDIRDLYAIYQERVA